MNGIHKGNNRLLAEYVQTGKGAIDDELHFEDVTLFFFFFLKRLRRGASPYAYYKRRTQTVLAGETLAEFCLNYILHYVVL